MNVPQLPARFTQIEALSSTPLERTFRAVDTLLQREVLLRLPAEAAWAGWSADTRTRLLREAQSLAKVQHECAESVLWVEETSEGLLVVQPLPTGERLGDHLKTGPMAVDAVVGLGIGLGEALAAVHYAGIVHRGIGPDAVRLRADGRPLLGGFHFAKAVDQAGGGSSLNHGLRRKSGTEEEAMWLPAYSAPEQLQGKKADARADVYALGCLLFRCLVGSDPLPSGDGAQMPDVRSVRPEVPKPLAEVLRRCMLAEKTARFPTAQSVVEALKELRAAKSAPPSRRGVVSAAVAAAAVVAIGVAMWPGEGAGSKPLDGPRPGPDPVPFGGKSDRTPAYSASYQKGHALLIGIGKAYAGSPYQELVTPVNEVARVAERLKQIDPVLWNDQSVKVLPEHEATGKRISQELRRIQDTAGENDCVFVYFAGHGQRREGSDGYWLVAKDVESKQPDAGGSEPGYVSDMALTDLRNGAAKHVLVVLDCCYAGAVGERLFVTQRNLGRTPKCEDESAAAHRELEFCRHRARQFLLSASADKTAADGVDGLSRFCRAFLAALQPPVPGARYVTVGMIKEKIALSVSKDQLPELRENDCDKTGTFVFFLPEK